MSLTTSLTAFQDAVREIPALNQGGCGAFALAVINKLKQTKVNYRIRVANPAWTFLFGPIFKEDALKELDSPDVDSVFDVNDKGIMVGHIFPEIEVDGEWRAFDSNYFLPTEQYLDKTDMVAYDGSISANVLERLVNNPVGWNDRFDRQNIKTIFQKADQAFA